MKEIEKKKKKRNKKINEIEAKIKIISKTKEDTAGFSGIKAKVEYEGKEYNVEMGGFEQSSKF